MGLTVCTRAGQSQKDYHWRWFLHVAIEAPRGFGQFSLCEGRFRDIGVMGIEYKNDKLTDQIIYCVIRVHQALGPGFQEKIYGRALLIELRKQNLATEIQKDVRIFYDGRDIGFHRLDLVVEGQVILELKTVEALSKAHYAQLRSYLKATGVPLGLLINFASDRADFRRVRLSNVPKGDNGDNGD
jgi:GxxExxY protein